jgi:nucleoside-specific outer membrane channel protein Tsx
MTRIFIACATLVLSFPAYSKQLWSSTSLSVASGQDYAVPYEGDTGDESRKLYTLEHASGQTWGDTFFFVERTETRDGHSETYAELSPRLSLGKVSGNSLAFGPVTDVLLAGTMEWVSAPGNAQATNYLSGVGFDLAIPGFSFFQLNAFHRNNDGGESNWQLTPVWGVPFVLGGWSLLFDGFSDWRSTREGKATETNVTSQLTVDIGQALFGEEKVLFTGLRYVYIRNKYGIEDGTQAFSSDERNLNVVMKAFF